MSELNSVFRPVKPLEYFQQFRQENPTSTWQQYLQFFLDKFPQRDEQNQLNYLIEGGTAIKLLHPERKDPTDIDIIDLKGNLAKQIGPNTRWFNSVTSEEWFKDRDLQFTPQASERLTSNAITKDFEGKEVTIMTPETLAMTKKLPYKGREFREKDIEDLKLLGIPEEHTQQQVNSFIELTKTS